MCVLVSVDRGPGLLHRVLIELAVGGETAQVFTTPTRAREIARQLREAAAHADAADAKQIRVAVSGQCECEESIHDDRRCPSHAVVKVGTTRGRFRLCQSCLDAGHMRGGLAE